MGAGSTRLLTRARPFASKIQADFTCGSEEAQAASAAGAGFPRAAAAGQVAQELGGVVGHRATPAARVLRADWDGVMPITGPSPASAQARPAAASTHVFPDPAGAFIPETRLPSVSTASAAAA